MKKPIPIFEWNEGLATGLPHVDEQHMQLFGIINELSLLHADGAGAERISAVLDEARRFATRHFQEEEELMATSSVNAEHQHEHLVSHNEFIHYLDRIGALVSANPGIAINMLLAFLMKWLVQHVTGIDMIMARKIAEQTPDSEAARISAHHSESAAMLIDSMSDLYDELGERTFEMLELNLRLEQEIARRKAVEQDLSLSEAQFRAVVDYAFNWEYWQSPDGRMNYSSPSCERITGYTAAEFIGNPQLIFDIIHADDRHLMEAHCNSNTVHEAADEEIEFRIVKKNGKIGWIAHSCNTIYLENGEFLGRRGCNRDRTERHKNEDSLRLAQTVFNSVNEAVLVTDQNNRIVAVNPSFVSITGYTEEEALGKDPSILSDGKADPDVIKGMWEEITRSGRWQGEITNRKKNGQFYIAWISINSVRNAKGEATNFVSVFSDISERKINEERMQYLAHYDSLTNLPNRALFFDRLRQAVIHARREHELLALMFVDLDKFKSVNDTLGHHVGDLLLKEVALRLRTCIRESDTAARIGGDEFVVLLPSIQAERDAIAVAEKILEAVTAPCELDGHEVRIGVSIGIAVYPAHGKNDEALLTNADAAMYQAKHGGGPSIMSFGDLK